MSLLVIFSKFMKNPIDFTRRGCDWFSLIDKYRLGQLTENEQPLISIPDSSKNGSK